MRGAGPRDRHSPLHRRAREIRRIFTTEGIALAGAGWLLGVPLGYVLDGVIVRLVWEVVDVRVPVVSSPCISSSRSRVRHA
jgi:hypothetical protein